MWPTAKSPPQMTQHTYDRSSFGIFRDETFVESHHTHSEWNRVVVDIILLLHIQVQNPDNALYAFQRTTRSGTYAACGCSSGWHKERAPRCILTPRVDVKTLPSDHQERRPREESRQEELHPAQPRWEHSARAEGAKQSRPQPPPRRERRAGDGREAAFP